MGLASYCSRTFIRLSTNPGFGKDSIKNTLHNLTGKVNNIKPRSIPGVLKELTADGEVVLNESSGMKKDIRDLLQEIILQLGDGSVTYANGALRSGAHQTKDKYDVHKLSITAMFNRVEDYKERDDFFDYQFSNNTAVKDRLLPIRLSGLLTENFQLDFDYNKLMKENTGFLADIIKNIEYWKENHLNELKPYINPSNDIKGRHKQSLNVLFNFINLYSDSQEEHTKWCNLLLQRIKDYDSMINGDVFHTIPQAEEKDFMTVWKEDAPTTLKCLQDFINSGISEDDVNKLKEEGIIVKFKSDGYGLL